jgi:hypothetical protein
MSHIAKVDKSKDIKFGDIGSESSLINRSIEPLKEKK